MFEQVFDKCALDETCTYAREDFKVAGKWGAKVPISLHRLRITYEGTEIQLKYDLGNHNLAEINVVIPVNSSVANFKLLTKAQLTRLVSLNKTPWKVTGEDKELNQQLSKMLDESGLTQLAKDELFDPTIDATFEDSKYIIYTRYYLGFNNKEKSVDPVIDFYKKLVQYIVTNYGS